MRGASAVVSALLVLALVAWVLGGGERRTPAAAPDAGAVHEAAAPAASLAPDAAEHPERPAALAPTPSPAPAPATADAERRPEAATAAVDAAQPEDDPVGCVVFGRVTAAEGAPLVDRNVYVGFRDANDAEIHAGVRADGSYVATGLAPGTWLGTAAARGYREAPFALEIGAHDDVLRRDFELSEAVTLRVRVTALDGMPLFDAFSGVDAISIGMHAMEPIATVERPGRSLAGVRGVLNNPVGVGVFHRNGFDEQLPPEYLGSLELRRDPPVFVSLTLRNAVLVTERVEPGQDEVAFVLDPAIVGGAYSGLSLRVTDAATGAAIEGAQVSLYGGNYEGPPAESDADGRVNVVDKEPGAFDVRIGKQGLATVRRRVELPPGEVFDLGTIELPAATSITGRLVDGDGAPAQASIELGLLGADGSVTMIVGQYWGVNETGEFKISALEPGDYLVRTSTRLARRGSSAPRIATDNRAISTRGGSVEGVELVLHPLGRVVLRHARGDWRELRLALVDANGTERVARGLYDARQDAVAVPRGTYRLRVVDGAGKALVDREVAVGDEPLQVEIPAE